MRVSVIVPTLDEESVIVPTLEAVRRGAGADDELLVVDGGSSDRTVELAGAAGAVVLHAARGRGRQMNAGAAAARGDVLLFVHADTLLPDGYRDELERVLEDPAVRWGRFDVSFDEGGPLLRWIARLISWRSRLFRSATGDQAIFVRSDDFESVGAYREELLFEDVDLARRLRACGGMGIPPSRVVTSARRWRRRGVWATTLRMWTLKSLYLAGVRSGRLARHYGDER